jgi:hypothetical protein
MELAIAQYCPQTSPLVVRLGTDGAFPQMRLDFEALGEIELPI